MASKCWLMLLLLTWRESMHCSGLTVDPPEDLQVLDPGRLGNLEITWSPPASLVNVTDCSKQYQLEYFNTYENSWTRLRTPATTETAQFDLLKDVRVRVYTMLSGPCTNGTLIKSTSYAELVHIPPSTGIADTAVQGFDCVYHNRKYVECTWRRNSKAPANSQQNLYFWHKKLEKAEECPKYLISSGSRIGCIFNEKSLPESTDINLCVNGSSPQGPLKQTYTTLQIQNHIKPEAAEKLQLKTGPQSQLELHWDRPAGRIPEHCLEWEVEHKQLGPDGKTSSLTISTKQMSVTLTSALHNERRCFRVRSRLHHYCAEKSNWSEWSRPTCYPEKKEVAAEPERDMVPVYVYIAVAIISILVLSLCVGAVLKMRRSRLEKRPDSLLTALFGRSSVLTVAEA